MGSVYFYEQQITICYEKIKKYERQIDGLRDFKRENNNGIEEFSAKIKNRRKHIANSLEIYIKYPLAKKVNRKLSSAIDLTYENNVINNFEEVDKDIIRAIQRLENYIEDEKYSITRYRNEIQEIKEAERRAEEEAERRAEAERREEKPRRDYI